MLARYFISVSIHVPRAGYDVAICRTRPRSTGFLSTYPVRGTTRAHTLRARCRRYFYPRTPCGVRRSANATISADELFLSTYPVRGTTTVQEAITYACAVFLSTYPVRGTTACPPLRPPRPHISIHVPRAGYDGPTPCHSQRLWNFYPRTPCGVRRGQRRGGIAGEQFLSTYPVRGTTCYRQLSLSGIKISIHVPRAGYDARRVYHQRNSCISIHVPRAGYDVDIFV